MAKKAELLEQAKNLKLDVSEKNTIAEIAEAIRQSSEQGVMSDEEASKEESQVSELKPQGSDDKVVAKAGKRSAKAIAEAEEKEAKETRKAEKAEAEKEEKPKAVQKVRSRLERRGKNFRKVAEQIEKDKAYNLTEALELTTKTNPAKFDATVEVHIRLNVDPRQADQNIRDTIVMPAGTGKSVRVAVFADGEDVDKAKKAGADIAAADEFLQQLDKGTIGFDVLVATPKVMAKLGKYARVLGPKGLMPNPKSGTVTADVAKAIKEAKAGRVEYRVDSTGIIHVGIGKVSFGKDKLTENAKAFLTSVKGNKPGSLKGSYVKSLYVTTSMGPSITVDTSEVN
jgi:large subunit ribosomal protein L1